MAHRTDRFRARADLELSDRRATCLTRPAHSLPGVSGWSDAGQMSYDITPYVANPDEVWLQARVSWTPRGGDTLTAEDDYVDGRSGTAHLGCGIESVIVDLGLSHFDSSEKYLMVCDLVNRQLEHRPWAELHCPEGLALLELIPPPS